MRKLGVGQKVRNSWHDRDLFWVGLLNGRFLIFLVAVTCSGWFFPKGNQREPAPHLWRPLFEAMPKRMSLPLKKHKTFQLFGGNIGCMSVNDENFPRAQGVLRGKNGVMGPFLIWVMGRGVRSRVEFGSFQTGSGFLGFHVGICIFLFILFIRGGGRSLKGRG